MLLLLAHSLAAPVGAAEQSGFQRAAGTREWQFPRDHGQHPAYRLEWWYYTGIVRNDAGRRFGYQVTFFRQALRAPGAKPRDSAWSVDALYLAHAAISDPDSGRYLRVARVGRDSLGLSGASATAHQVWLEDWRVDPLEDDPQGVRITLAATEGDGAAFTLRLELRSPRDASGNLGAAATPVLHGVGGLDAKGAEPGQASWYYSLPHLKTVGALTLDGKTFSVQGSTWMDHEFGTGQMAPQLVGWDWLALRLEDGSALMLYRLRRRDGTPSPQSAGSLIAADGQRTPLLLSDAAPPNAVHLGDLPQGTLTARMTPGQRWRSPTTGGAYPLHWRIEVPARGLVLDISPALDAQEQPGGAGAPFAYWEGLVDAVGTQHGAALRGEGYLELAGYAGELGGALRR